MTFSLDFSTPYSIFTVSKPSYVETITGYSKVPYGWLQGEGIPPSSDTITNALRVAHYAHDNFLSVNTALGGEGEIQLAVFRNKPVEKYWEITVEPNGEYSLLEFELVFGSWQIMADEILHTFNEVRQLIKIISRETHKCQSSSEFFPRSNFIKILTDIAVQHSGVLETEYQSSFFPVPQKKVQQYVTI